MIKNVLNRNTDLKIVVITITYIYLTMFQALFFTYVKSILK